MILISVIIATRNRQALLDRCLCALANQSIPWQDFEVIVVDDGSAQPPHSLVQSYQAKLQVQLLTQRNQGAGAARNHGFAHASGRFVAFTDDDCAPEPDWLKHLIQELENAPGSAVGGITVNALAENIYSAGSQLLIDYLYQYHNSGGTSVHFLTGNHVACSAESFAELGGFDSEFSLSVAEDRDFCRRFLDSGRSLRYAPRAKIMHAHELSLASFIKQHFKYGRGAFLFHMREAQSRGTSLKVEPIQFYLALVLYPLKSSTSARSVAMSMLIVVSQVANAIGFLAQGAIFSLNRIRSRGQTTFKTLEIAPIETCNSVTVK